MKKFDIIELDYKFSQIYPLKVKFPDEQKIYDFSFYSDNEFSRTIAQTFYNLHEANSPLTRDRTYRGIKKFLSNITKISLLTELTQLIFIEFASWLNIQPFSLSTKYSYYNSVEQLFNEVKKNKKHNINLLNIPANPFIDITATSSLPEKLTSQQLKIVASKCKEEIDLYINNLQDVQNKILMVEQYIQKGGNLNPKDRYHIIYNFYNKYGYIPWNSELTNPEIDMVQTIGGMKELTKYISPEAEVLFPFYILILIELAGNSDAVRLMSIDCIKEDPLFEDRCFITWEKGRATNIQKRNVFKKTKYGAYQLINNVLEVTKNSRKKIAANMQDFLWICRSIKGKEEIIVIPPKSFNDITKRFCKNHNLNFNFNVSDIRPSILTEIYKDRKDIVAVSKIANHKSIATTLSYIVDDETKKENIYYLSTKQDKIINNLFKSKEITENLENNSIYANAHNTAFTCKNPIIDSNTCINWMAELTNPDLIIPSDPKYLSKIIALKLAIHHTSELMNKERFKVLYEPILHMIEQQILPKFSQDIIDDSYKIAKKHPIDFLGEY